MRAILFFLMGCAGLASAMDPRLTNYAEKFLPRIFEMLSDDPTLLAEAGILTREELRSLTFHFDRAWSLDRVVSRPGARLRFRDARTTYIALCDRGHCPLLAAFETDAAATEGYTFASVGHPKMALTVVEIPAGESIRLLEWPEVGLLLWRQGSKINPFSDEDRKKWLRLTDLATTEPSRLSSDPVSLTRPDAKPESSRLTPPSIVSPSARRHRVWVGILGGAGVLFILWFNFYRKRKRL